MANKPSFTKQIGEMLGTEKKAEQVEVLKRLTNIASVPPIAVTVLYTAAGVQVTYTSPVQATPNQLKQVLQGGVDEITAMLVKAEMQKEEPAEMTAEQRKQMSEEITDYKKEHPDKEFVPIEPVDVPVDTTE